VIFMVLQKPPIDLSVPVQGLPDGELQPLAVSPAQ
jgi:hypothetical protein